MSSKIKSFFRRISKDHGGGGAAKAGVSVEGQLSDDRKFSASAAGVIVPSKRSHSKEILDVDEPTAVTTKENCSGKPLKYKKMSGQRQETRDTIDEADELMETEAVHYRSGETATSSNVSKEVTARSKTNTNMATTQTVTVSRPSSSSSASSKESARSKSDSSQVSATITINSLVPEQSSVDQISSASNKGEPIPPLRRNSKDIVDGGAKRHYALKNASESGGNGSTEPVKSVSITKLQADEPTYSDTKSEIVSATAKVISNTAQQRKLSPTKSYLSSDFPSHPKNSLTASKSHPSHLLSSDFSLSETLEKVPATKRVKKSREDDSEYDDENTVKNLKDKITSLEKMISDLVKNAEIKKQEIAALKMEIKRLKVSTICILFTVRFR